MAKTAPTEHQAFLCKNSPLPPPVGCSFLRPAGLRSGRTFFGIAALSARHIERRFALYGQATYGQQWTNAFHAPYIAANSLTPSGSRETADVTLFLGARLWRGAEVWVTPEIDQGFGLDNTLGVAGFPSGLAYKVGAHDPYFRLPRAFVRQTINDGGPAETVEGLAGQDSRIAARA